MKKLLLVASLTVTTILFAEAQSKISVIDFVKTKNGKQQEAFYFYENNWKIYRDIALEKGFIYSYKLLKTSADSAANFDLILITEYTDSAQFNLGEERFQQIIKATRPGGPKLLNELKPNDFRQNLFFKKAEILFSPGNTK